ncbi:protein of unknown function [Pseudotevenvirus RB43]|uniref:Uncharacterized protein n=2 Tax=Pseudotevenvirus RB43 TaxID=115991 RepID=Q56BM8_9CAUD|nr:hypothetical protein RB43ORF170c [Escherichia phage RB43]AAX78692.1 hypothetical protein RB43ORF170c [Escherichia phage RB43]CCK74015.1 protein of unknown function [Pseudotevenvirus RB43]CCL97632.1 protein of unknown function [Pseudotevenvirus RB43]
MKKYEIDKRELPNKTVTLFQYVEGNDISSFWRVNVENEKSGTSMPFDNEVTARAVFRSHIQF